jgi:RNA recognition motif-containing protein
MDFDGTKRKQTIYVGGLHEESNERELIEVFSAFGKYLTYEHVNLLFPDSYAGFACRRRNGCANTSCSYNREGRTS